MKHVNIVPNRYSSTPFISLVDNRDENRMFVDFREVQSFATRRQYKVKVGDTLQSIASNVYGYPEMWFVLYEHNLEKINHPTDLTEMVGESIDIPDTTASEY